MKNNNRPNSEYSFKQDNVSIHSKTNSTIMLREAKIEDLMFLYNLRNEPSVIESSFVSERIDLETHKNWFNDKINSDHCSILIAEYEGKHIGQIRFDFDKKIESAVVSIAVSSKYRNKGLGVKILKLGCQYASKFFSIKKCIAFIRINNKVSVKAFSKAGFTKKGYSDKKGYTSIEMTLECARNS